MKAKGKKNKYKRRREDILSLRRQGLSYREIAKSLGCSKATISYHCGQNQSEKRRVKSQEKSPLCKKVGAFKARCTRASWRYFRHKVKTFKRRAPGRGRTKWRVHNISTPYDCNDVVEKIGAKPVCYLTGKKIDLNMPSSYNLDHIVPTSKGGTNDLDNLGITCINANQAKGSLSLEEFHKLCEDVLRWRDKCKRLIKRSLHRQKAITKTHTS